MSATISLPHFEQSAEGYCLPACARMVLASLGMNLAEPEIANILGTQDYGTPSFAIRQLTILGANVNYHEWSVAQLLAELEAKHPVILFVHTGFLDHWTIDVAHAIVAVGAVPTKVISVTLRRDFSSKPFQLWRVIPVVSETEIAWNDPASYVLASSSKPLDWRPENLELFDFVLDPERQIVSSSPYL
ncbi:MAG: C39 family peptidase [Chloroflexi bacterium]|nr:C39 family peptidase [Chloroflexota bacterium]